MNRYNSTPEEEVQAPYTPETPQPVFSPQMRPGADINQYFERGSYIPNRAIAPRGITNKPPVRGGGLVQNWSPNIDAILANQQAGMSSMSGLPTGPERTGGGTGGGSTVMQGDPMSSNSLVGQNLNPYLTQNVHSFEGGGRMHNPYQYNYGGGFPQQTMSYTDQANEMIALNQLSGLGQRAMANKGMKRRYTQGGRF